MPSMIPYGNINKLSLVSVTWSPTIVNANTTSAQTVTIPGLVLGQDFILDVTKPTEQTGLGIVSARVSANDTATVVFMNNTASGITPAASQVYTFAVARRDGPAIGNFS